MARDSAGRRRGKAIVDVIAELPPNRAGEIDVAIGAGAGVVLGILVGHLVRAVGAEKADALLRDLVSLLEARRHG